MARLLNLKSLLPLLAAALLSGCRGPAPVHETNTTIEIERQGAPRVILPRDGAVHVVGPGETLTSICAAHGKSVDAIEKVNGLKPGQTLHAGTKLFIPGAAKPLTTSVVTLGADTAGMPKLVPYRGPRKAPMIWPTRGKVQVGYQAPVHFAPSDGIGILAPPGGAVWAAKDGKVVFQHENLFGAGRVILIEHDGGLITMYGHLQESLVKDGQTVRQGDVIARAGQSGRTSRPQVHFRVYRNGDPVDPMKYLD